MTWRDVGTAFLVVVTVALFVAFAFMAVANF
jgi:hypothetical protein